MTMVRSSKFVKKKSIMPEVNEAKKKALQLTLDKLDKTYGKGAVMKLSDDYYFIDFSSDEQLGAIIHF